MANCDPDLILVSNNVYKLEGIGGLGTRARLDEGVLGVIVVEVHNGAELAQLVSLSTAGRGSAYAGWHEWSTPTLEVRSGKPIDIGIDGEAVTLDSPVRLEVQPGALRVRIAPHHPGVSPARAASAVQDRGPASPPPRRVRRLTARECRAAGAPDRPVSIDVSPPGLGAPARALGPDRAADGEHLSHGRSRNPTGDSPDRRDRRRDRNRQQARRVVGIVAGVLAVAAVALVASDLVRLSGEDKPSLAGTVQVTRNDGESRAATTTTGTRSCRPLTVTDPLRLWVGGDSLAGSLGPSLGKLAGATGVVQPYFDSRVSSGLADPGFFDWPDHAATEMARASTPRSWCSSSAPTTGPRCRVTGRTRTPPRSTR